MLNRLPAMASPCAQLGVTSVPLSQARVVCAPGCGEVVDLDTLDGNQCALLAARMCPGQHACGLTLRKASTSASAGALELLLLASRPSSSAGLTPTPWTLAPKSSVSRTL